MASPLPSSMTSFAQAIVGQPTHAQLSSATRRNAIANHLCHEHARVLHDILWRDGGGRGTPAGHPFGTFSGILSGCSSVGPSSTLSFSRNPSVWQ
eukprot:1968058-Pyramimonas_sp.AAC.1